MTSGAEVPRELSEDGAARGSGLDRPELDAQFLWTLVRAAYRAERMLTRDLGALALSPIQFGVLSQLAVESSASSAHLARLCFVRPQTMAGVVDGMVARELVRREGSGGRGRPARIALTVEGRALFARAWPLFRGTNAAVTAGIPDDEAPHLNALLHRVAVRDDGPGGHAGDAAGAADVAHAEDSETGP